MAFTGFPKQAITFLRQLERNNNREWFESHRPDYKEHIMGPSKEFVLAMGEKLDAFDPSIEAEPRVNASVRRINRDTRFSQDKTPYKTHIDFLFPHQTFKGRPGYWVRISPTQIHVGTGLYQLDPKQLATWRIRVADDSTGKALAEAISGLEKAHYAIHGERYKRVPKGFDADHPREHLLRYRGLHAGIDVPHPGQLTTKAFPAYVIGHFKRLRPVTDWLVDLVEA